jgi:hypothetical protein
MKLFTISQGIFDFLPHSSWGISVLLMNCRRNRISFDFFTSHFGLSDRFLVSSVLTDLHLYLPFPSYFQTFSSVFCLSDTDWVFILAVHSPDPVGPPQQWSCRHRTRTVIIFTCQTQSTTQTSVLGSSILLDLLPWTCIFFVPRHCIGVVYQVLFINLTSTSRIPTTQSMCPQFVQLPPGTWFVGFYGVIFFFSTGIRIR